ncbi:MAG: helix-hairpin-helix domain-containing protein [Pseudomonadota bacterium]
MDEPSDAKFSLKSARPECLLLGFSSAAFGLLFLGSLGLYANFWNVVVFAAWLGLGYVLTKYCTENPDGIFGRLLSSDDDAPAADVPEWLLRTKEIEARNFGTIATAHAVTPQPAPSTPRPAAPKPKSTPKSMATAPEPAAPIAAEGAKQSKPDMLAAARGGKGDDLTRIKGVGPKLAGALNDMGIHHFDQIAAWNEDNLKWVDENLLAFKGRASRDNWIDQAKELMGP